MSKLSRRLKKLGTQASVQWSATLNHDEPVFFSSESEMIAYINHYRESNVIFQMSLNRIEIYSL